MIKGIELFLQRRIGKMVCNIQCILRPRNERSYFLNRITVLLQTIPMYVCLSRISNFIMLKTIITNKNNNIIKSLQKNYDHSALICMTHRFEIQKASNIYPFQQRSGIKTYFFSKNIYQKILIFFSFSFETFC